MSRKTTVIVNECKYRYSKNNILTQNLSPSTLIESFKQQSPTEMQAVC